MIHTKLELTTKQEECVIFKPEGSLLVRGIPGSGKSTIILARAQYLMENFPDESVLILTYSRTLTNYVRQLSLKTGEPVEASTFHNWARTLLKETDYPHTRLIIGDDREGAVKFAINIIRKHKEKSFFPELKTKNNEFKALTKFMADEIEWIKGLGISTRKEYLSMKRSGRGKDVRISKKHRETIYDVLEKYNELLKRHKNYQGVDNEDLARILVEKAAQIPREMKPDHILVDEAQDLHTLQLTAIRKMSKKSLTVGADKGQQIYRNSFTWKKAGIEVAGNRSRYLDETFRSTKQIIKLAKDFQKNDKIFIKDDEYLEAKEPETEGKIPEIILSETAEIELKGIVAYIKEIRGSFSEDTIGVIGSIKSDLEKLEGRLNNEGIPVNNLSVVKNLDLFSPGVKLITSLSSKGIEFDHVIVMGLKKGKLPYSKPQPGEDEDEFMSRERKKFYVAMTRAKKTLLISGVKPYSSFIEDLNSDYYNIRK